VSQSYVSTTAPSPGRAGVGTRPSRWTGGRITAIAIGSLLGLIALSLLATGAMGLWYDRTQRDAGFVTTAVHDFSASGSALATVRTDLGPAGKAWLYAPALLNKVRIRVTPRSSDSQLFVGIGPTSEVDRYLAGVSHTVITDFFGNQAKDVGGSTTESAPATQHFWAASTTGSGARTLTWNSARGSWTVVVMNADGRPGIDIGADLGARMPSLPWVALGVLVGGAVFGLGAALLIRGAIRVAGTV
jgi:hypothetical protein